MGFYSEKIVKKPQKEHRCDGCCKKMPLNRKHWYISGAWVEGFFTARLCFACKKHLENNRCYAEDGWGTGDLKEGRLEVINSYKWHRSRRSTKK